MLMLTLIMKQNSFSSVSVLQVQIFKKTLLGETIIIIDALANKKHIVPPPISVLKLN